MVCCAASTSTKPTPEHIELVGVGDMAVQTDAHELRENVNPIQAAVDAVADRDIDETIFPRDGNCGFARSLVSGNRRSPRPPPRIRLNTDCMERPHRNTRSRWNQIIIS